MEDELPLAELYDDQNIAITGMEYRASDLVKLVPGVKWKPKVAGAPWFVPLSWGACKTLRGVFGDRLLIGPKLTEWSWQEWETRVKPCMDIRTLTERPLEHPLLDAFDRVERSYGDVGELYPFQVSGALFLATARQALLADQMGSGKSLTTITALRVLQESGEQPFPALIICPNSVKHHWQRELNKWCPQLVVNVVSGPATERRKRLRAKAHVYVMNWESVLLHSRLAPYGSINLKRCVAHGGSDPKVSDARCEVHHKELNDVNFRTVIADECHRLKSVKVKQTRAVWAVAHQPSVEFRFGLSGTPIANDPSDLWSVMHFLAPREFPTRVAWVDRFALCSWNAFGGMDIIGIRPETKDEFYSIIDPRMRRMPKSLVLSYLPPKVHLTREVEMGKAQAKAYQQMKTGLIAKLESGLLLTTNPLTQMLRLVQFSSSYAELDEVVDEVTGAIETKVRLSEPSNKLDEFMEFVDELGPGYPLVVTAPSRQLIMLAQARLAKAKISTRLIVGGMTTDQRQVGVDDFMSGRAQVILGSHGAMKEGLTLTRADTLVRLQRSWSLLDELQVMDRVHRIGSEVHDSIKIVDIITPGTVEWKQFLILRDKEERLQEVVRDRETLLAGIRAADGAGDAQLATQLRQRLSEMDERIVSESELSLRDPGFLASLLNEE